MIVARVIHGVKSHFVLRFQEWLMTFMLLEFGLSLLRPAFSFAQSPIYEAMAKMATEQTWAACILLVACLRLLALVINGTFRDYRRASPYVRAGTAYLSAFAWASIAIGIMSVNANVTGGGTYFGLTFGDLVLGYIVVDEAAAAERAHRNGRSEAP